MSRMMLFVCTGNTCRSAMAAAVARQTAQLLGIGPGEIRIVSAGTGALGDEPASAQAVQVMAEMGLDLSGHRSTLLTPQLIGEADLVLCMTAGQKRQVLARAPEAQGKVWLLTEYAGNFRDNQSLRQQDIPDPFGLPAEYYRQCAGQLRELMPLILRKFLRRQDNPT